MKSSKLVMKSNALVRMGQLSVITLMALSLSVGTVRAAEDFKLWHVSVGDAKGTELSHASDEHKADAIKWLVTDPTDKKVEKFVESFSKEPFQFLEGIKAAKEEAEKLKKSDDFRRTLDKVFGDKSKIKDDVFGGKKERQAFKELVDAMMKKEKLGEDFLKDLFTKPSLLADLNLREAKKVTPEPSKSPEPPVLSPQPPVGEVIDDGALQRQAQQICDKFNGLRDEQLKSLKDQINPLKDALNETFNKLAGLSQPVIDQNALNRNRNEKGLEDILPGLLANALNNDKAEEVTPSSNNQQPFLPQTQRREDREDQPQFNSPVPDPQPQQQPQVALPQQAQSSAAPVIRRDLPSVTGKQELMDTQSSLTELNRGIKNAEALANQIAMGASNPNDILNQAGQAALAKGTLKAGLDTAEARLANAKNRLNILDTQIEEVKESGLPAEVRQKQAALKAEVDQKKSQMQMLQSLAPEQAQQLLPASQQAVSQAEAALAQYNASVEVSNDEVKARIKKMERNKDQLQSAVSDLEGKINTAQSQIQAMDQVMATAKQQVMMQQMQPQTAGTPNINRLQGFSGGSSGAPRTTAPRLGTSLQSGTSNQVRGSLGAQK